METLRKWIYGAAQLLFWLSPVAAVLMMLHVSLDVSGRTVFRQPIEGTGEIVAAYYMVAIAYLPWAWVARKDNHIRVDLFARFMSDRVRDVLHIFTSILTTIYLGFFVWQSTVSAIRQFRNNEVWLVATGYLPVWPARWILPLAGLLMILCLLLRLADDVGQLRRSKSSS